MGFVPRDVTLYTPDPGATLEETTEPSDNVADINGSVHALYLRTDIPTRSVFESESGSVSDVLGKISLNTNPGGIIVHNPSDSTHQSVVAVNHDGFFPQRDRKGKNAPTRSDSHTTLRLECM